MRSPQETLKIPREYRNFKFSPKGLKFLLLDKKLEEKRETNNRSLARLIKPGTEGNSAMCSNLQVLVVYFQHISDIEGSLLGTAGLFHELGIDVPSRRHYNNDVLSLFVEEEGNISYL